MIDEQLYTAIGIIIFFLSFIIFTIIGKTVKDNNADVFTWSLVFSLVIAFAWMPLGIIVIAGGILWIFQYAITFLYDIFTSRL